MSDSGTQQQTVGKVSRRQFLRLSLAATAALPVIPAMLASCSTAPAATPTQPAAQAGPSPASTKRSLSMAYDAVAWWKDTQAKEFTEATGIEFNYESIPFQQLHDKYLASFMSGGGEYDLVHVRDDYAVEWGPKGWLEPLDARITDDMRKEHFPEAFKYLSYQNVTYGIPRYIWLWQFYYNTEILNGAGLKEPPKTWDELREAAKGMTKPPQYGLIAALGSTQPVNLFTVRLRAEGGEMMKDRQPTFNNAQGVAALQSLVDLINDGSVDPSSFELGTTTPTIDVFTQGRAGMILATPPTLAMAADPAKSKVVGKVSVALMPGSKVPSAGYSELGGVAITSTCKDKDAAWEYVKFVTSAEQQKKMALAIGRIPTMPALLQDAAVQENYQAAAMAAEQMKYPMGMAIVVPEQQEINTAMANELVAALRGQKSVEKALADAEAATIKILGS